MPVGGLSGVLTAFKDGVKICRYMEPVPKHRLAGSGPLEVGWRLQGG